MRIPTLVLISVVMAAPAWPGQSFYAPSGWDAELRARGVDPTEVPYPLAITEGMRQEAQRLSGAGDQLHRLRRLQAALFNEAQFPFQYELRETLTAAEAFFRRQGNCLSFTNMFVAMARSLGIPVTTGLVLQNRGSEREGDLVIVNNHVVAVFNHAGTPVYFDFDHTRRQPVHSAVPLDDYWITGLYLNNRGGDYLREGRLDLAAQHFRNAARLAPDFSPAWGNLGVTLRRLGDTDGALQAYGKAVELDPENPTILHNLAALYRHMNQDEKAEQALAAADYSIASPHLLIVRGDLKMAQGDPDAALRFYRRARRQDPNLAAAWLGMARAELARERQGAAERFLERARRLQPEPSGVRAAASPVKLPDKL